MSQHLHLHRAERADRLVDALAEVLAQPLADPFTTEVVCVPTRGVERWLAQRLSHRLGPGTGGPDGTCAASMVSVLRSISFPSLRRRLGPVGSTTRCRPTDPWQPDRAVWPLLRVIDDSRNESWAALLWSFLAGTSDVPNRSPPEQSDAPSAIADRPAIGSRRWRTTRQLAELFTRYASSRPAMIDHWAAGRDVDAQGDPLPTDLAWQAELWRRLRDRLGAPSPPERLRAAMPTGRRAQHDVLPARLSVFGVTRLDHDHQQVLTALAEHREVHLWLPHPSPALWTAVAADPAGGPGAGRRADDPTTALTRHPLLGYLGRDSRELQIGLDATGAITSDRHHPAEAARRDPSSTVSRPTWPPTPIRRPDIPLDPNDRSVQIHATYGPDRQVEVLREVLVGLLADDPTLEPRDIVVMCPDIERFAPLVSAAFGLDTADDRAEHPGHRLRVRLADRSLRQLNPLLSVLSQVLDLADSRMTASSLLDLAAYPPVARKFGFTEDDTSRLASLVTQAGVRWGLDAPHRRPYGLEGFGQNTWAAGLDRMLLGVAMDADGDHFIGTALPLDDVDSSDVDLVGRLTEFVVRIRQVRRRRRRAAVAVGVGGLRPDRDRWPHRNLPG